MAKPDDDTPPFSMRPGPPRREPQRSLPGPRDTQPPHPSAPGPRSQKPAWVEQPFPHEADSPEPKSGVMHPVTGRTRELVIWLAIITAIGTALQPIIGAVAERISPSPANKWAREQQEMKAREANPGKPP